jgi:hypothetical protein
MLTKMPGVRSSRFFVVVMLAFGLVALATESFARRPPASGGGEERPVQRTLPRKQIYANLSEGLGVKGEEAMSLLQSVEDKGFPLRETVVLLLLAKAQADHQIEEGKSSKGQRVQALTATAEHLVGLVEKEKAGWVALVQKTGAKVDLSLVVAKANQIIGFYSERASVSWTIPLKEVPIVIEEAEGEEPEEENPTEQGESK